MGIGDWAQSPIPNPQSPIPKDSNSSIEYNPIWHKGYIRKALVLKQMKDNKGCIKALYKAKEVIITNFNNTEINNKNEVEKTDIKNGQIKFNPKNTLENNPEYCTVLKLYINWNVEFLKLEKIQKISSIENSFKLAFDNYSIKSGNSNSNINSNSSSIGRVVYKSLGILNSIFEGYFKKKYGKKLNANSLNQDLPMYNKYIELLVLNYKELEMYPKCISIIDNYIETNGLELDSGLRIDLNLGVVSWNTENTGNTNTNIDNNNTPKNISYNLILIKIDIFRVTKEYISAKDLCKYILNISKSNPNPNTTSNINKNEKKESSSSSTHINKLKSLYDNLIQENENFRYENSLDNKIISFIMNKSKDYMKTMQSLNLSIVESNTNTNNTLNKFYEDYNLSYSSSHYRLHYNTLKAVYALLLIEYLNKEKSIIYENSSSSALTIDYLINRFGEENKKNFPRIRNEIYSGSSKNNVIKYVTKYKPIKISIDSGLDLDNTNINNTKDSNNSSIIVVNNDNFSQHIYINNEVELKYIKEQIEINITENEEENNEVNTKDNSAYTINLLFQPDILFLLNTMTSIISNISSSFSNSNKININFITNNPIHSIRNIILWKMITKRMDIMSIFHYWFSYVWNTTTLEDFKQAVDFIIDEEEDIIGNSASIKIVLDNIKDKIRKSEERIKNNDEKEEIESNWFNANFNVKYPSNASSNTNNITNITNSDNNSTKYNYKNLNFIPFRNLNDRQDYMKYLTSGIINTVLDKEEDDIKYTYEGFGGELKKIDKRSNKVVEQGEQILGEEQQTLGEEDGINNNTNDTNSSSMDWFNKTEYPEFHCTNISFDLNENNNNTGNTLYPSYSNFYAILNPFVPITTDNITNINTNTANSKKITSSILPTVINQHFLHKLHILIDYSSTIKLNFIHINKDIFTSDSINTDILLQYVHNYNSNLIYWGTFLDSFTYTDIQTIKKIFPKKVHFFVSEKWHYEIKSCIHDFINIETKTKVLENAKKIYEENFNKKNSGNLLSYINTSFIFDIERKVNWSLALNFGKDWCELYFKGIKGSSIDTNKSNSKDVKFLNMNNSGGNSCIIHNSLKFNPFSSSRGSNSGCDISGFFVCKE